MNCKFCNKELNPRGLSHVKYCSLNPDRIVLNRKGENNPMFGKPGTNQYIHSKKQGIDFVPSEKEKEFRKKRSKLGNDKRWSLPGAKENFSNKIREVVKNNPDSYSSSNVNGRVKKILYNDIWLDSSWEVEVAKWLDTQSLKWEKSRTGFPYTWEGKERTYYPDFYLVDLDIYIEVKGYIRARDYEKWKSIPDLIIIKEKEFLEILNNSYKLPV